MALGALKDEADLKRWLEDFLQTPNVIPAHTVATPALVIPDDFITAAMIAANAVGSSEIAADAVGSSEIAADAVGSSEIAASAVGTSEAPSFVNSTVENLKVIRGIIDTTGSGSIVEGSGFTISRTGTGQVTVTFSASFSDVPAIVLSPGESAGGIGAKLATSAPTASAFQMVVFATTTAGAVDSLFHFIAIGPR